MKVSLKRADVLARTALKLAGETRPDAQARFSIFAPSITSLSAATAPSALHAEVEKAHIEALEQHALSISLLVAAYDIRSLLAVANMKHNISVHLNSYCLLVAEEKRINALILAIDDNTERETDIGIAVAKAKAIREQSGERYFREHDVTIALFSKDDVSRFRRRLKQIAAQRMTINEQLTVANVSSTVILSAETIETLQKADIIVNDE